MKAFKRIFSIFMALILLLLPLAACDTPNAGDDTTVNDETTTPEETTTGDAPITQPTYATESFKITSETPLDEVIKLVEEYKSVPIVELPKLDVDLSLFIPQNYDCTESNSPIHLHRYADFMPIWYVKKIDDDHIYVVYRFFDESNQKTDYRYLFFEKGDRNWSLYGEGYEIPSSGAKPYQYYDGVDCGDKWSDHVNNLYGNIQYKADPVTNIAYGEAYVPVKEGILYVAFVSDKDYNTWREEKFPKDCFTITQVTFVPYGTQDYLYFNGQKIAITKIAGGPVFPNDAEAYY